MRTKKPPLNSFFRDPIIKNSTLISLILFGLSSLVLAFTYHRLPPVIPLFYSLTKGEKQLAPKPYIFFLPTTNILLIFAHTWICRLSFNQDRMFTRVISSASTIVTILFSVALIHILIILI